MVARKQNSKFRSREIPSILHKPHAYFSFRLMINVGTTRESHKTSLRAALCLADLNCQSHGLISPSID